MIFTLSPGRCGTKYLAYAMRLVPGVAAYHEAKPDFVDVMKKAQHDPSVATEFWINRKLPWIDNLIRPTYKKIPWMDNTKPSVYFESSHLFGKGFASALVDVGRIPAVIVLTRSHREVALSFWRRRSIPGRTRRGRDYLLDPTGMRDWNSLTAYQLCYWYCLEMQRRITYAAKHIRSEGGLVVSIGMYQMVTWDGFSDLCRRLTLPDPTRFLGSMIINGSSERRKASYPEGDMDALEDEVAWLCALDRER